MPTSIATPTRERPRRAAGFTLLELALTIGLLALVATMVGPRLAAPGGRTLRLVADDVARRLTAARWQAVVEGRPIRIPLDALAPGLRTVQPAAAPGPPAQSIAFDPVPAAVPRVLELTDAGATARITIPSGLAPLAVSVGDPS